MNVRPTAFLQALVVFLSIAPAGVRAEEAVVRDFKTSARSVPENLLRLGHDSFGRLRIAALLQQMEAPEVKASGFFQRAEVDAEYPTPLDQAARSTAQWRRLPNGRSEILVNVPMWKQVPRAAKAVIALHEHLGIAGFNDRNYELSTALWLLSLPEADRAFERDEKIQITANLGEMARSGSGGGITGVGGGGDFGGVTTRMNMLKKGIARLTGTSGEERVRRLREIGAALRLRAEVRWVNTKTKDFSYESMPAEIADEVQNLNLCKQYLQFDAAAQRNIFRILREQKPDVARILGSVERFRAGCKKAVAGTSLD